MQLNELTRWAVAVVLASFFPTLAMTCNNSLSNRFTSGDVMGSNSTIRDHLEQAIGTGQLIGIIYHGGSQPGSYREIAPLQINGDKVRARCYTSNAVKAFSLDKIELRGPVPTPEDEKIEWDPHNIKVPQFNDIGEIYRAHLTDLSVLGWTAEFEKYDDGEAIWLRSKFRNGSLRKTPDVGLLYEALIWNSVVQFDGSIGREDIRPRRRPWIVRSKAFDAAKTFSDVGAAVVTFLDEARQQAPQKV
jgi:hypothetical protein